MGTAPGSFWMTPHDIYVQLTTGPGSSGIDAVRTALNLAWKEEEERVTRTRLQGNLIQSAWQGPASDAAYGAAQPLAEAVVSGADLLFQAQDLVDRQSGSFNRAKNDVRPVATEPPKPNIIDMMSPFSDYEKQVTDYQSAAQHNIQVFRGYDGASSYNETRMPTEYSTPSFSGGGIGVVPDGSQGGDVIKVPDQGPDQKRQPGGEDPRPGGVSEPRQFGGGPDSGKAPVGGAPVGGPGAGGQPPQQTTSPNDFVPAPPGSVGQVPGGQPPSGNQPGPGGPGQGGFAPVGGFGPGGPGPRGGTYGGGPGRGFGPGPGGGVGGPGSTGRGPGGAFGPGARAGALAAEEVAAQRAAAAAAGRGTGAGAMGGGPMGGGRGKGDEDEEHKRKVLLEADAEGVFGSDVLTAPQVIGDDEYEDD